MNPDPAPFRKLEKSLGIRNGILTMIQVSWIWKHGGDLNT
jgi:hypothetical protein